MMPKLKAIYILLFFTGIVFSCSDKSTKNNIPVAKVGNNVLHFFEVENFIPNNTSEPDSILMAENYIKKWIQKELLIQKAEDNLSAEQKNVSKELLEYRNSLIIYKYKKEMVRQKMDTIVSDSSVINFYNKNISTFILNRNIVKAILLKIPIEVADPDYLKMYCENKSDENFNDLKEYCLQYAKSFDTFNDTWIDFNLVLNNIPNDIDDQARFLSRNELLEVKDSAYYYLVCINDYRLSGQPSPEDHVYNQIRNLILSKRKIDFLKNIEIDIYKEGIRMNRFNIYNYEK